MSSTNETGHAKNIANFTDLIIVCKSFGTRYNPGRAELKISAIGKQLADAEIAQALLNKQVPLRTAAVAQKDAAFKKLPSLTTRVLSYFKSCHPLEGELNNARTIAKKIKGETKKGKAAKEGEAGISTSQMSMDSRIENLNRLIEVIAANSNYTPNETELQVTGLATYAGQLKSLSEAVVTAEGPENEARASRNQLLYNSQTGLVATGNDIKAYIKGVFGVSSPEYKQVSGIRFVNRKI
jgi:hypothetical protein